MKAHIETTQPKNWFRRALISAAIITFLLVMAGYLIRFDGAENACPDWPTCYGQWGIPASLAAQLEMAHRILAGLAAATIFVVTIWAFSRRVSRSTVRYLLTGALIGVIAESLLASGLFPRITPLLTGNIHLALALITMALVTAAAVVGNLTPKTAMAEIPRSRYSRLAWLTMLTMLMVMLSGAWLTSAGTANACDGWPLCSGGLPTTQAGWLAFGHRLLTLFAGILVAALSILAWRKHYRQPVLLTSATAVGLLFVGQILISALKVERGYPIDLVGLHATATAALWATLIVTATAAIFEVESVHPEIQNHSRSVGAGRLKAFLMLNKPIIVALLLVTTFAGMVVGGKQMPTFWLAFWTLLGGALAAGGASALNQVIDRVIDGNMQRTAKRPLPSGALTPAEGLAYGVGACLAAFFILAGFVNLLAAVLSLAGMIYYVLLYSVWLKHATVQNIVIGGGAGAIPPLVGWAAATGALNIPSLFLFAIVFMWTPPHFWALAIVRKNDYARAGVPMLPVVKGEHYARIQIFIYTLELVALTLLMPLFKMTGSLFLVSAVVLGLWLIYAAWNVLRKPGNKVAWTMYRYSSMYLAFLFLALVLDVLI
ncbi:MAG TPA: heme o synthase [Bellilinea sp.]|nr:heme o synthase [Bellilinea sp.]